MPQLGAGWRRGELQIRKLPVICSTTRSSSRHARLSPTTSLPTAGTNIVLDPKGIIKECSHFNEAWRTGGKTHNQGLWMQTVLASTWFPNGRKFAHKFSAGYPTYTADETDKMYDRKENDRKSMGLGWPSCKTFENYGCKLCATCKHFGKIKSPLNSGPTATNSGSSAIICGPLR